MDTVAWRVGHLPADRENVVITSSGVEVDAAAALGAASAALVELIARVGRGEFRVVVGDVPITVIPGLTEAGRIDVDGLAHDLVAAVGWDGEAHRGGTGYV